MDDVKGQGHTVGQASISRQLGHPFLRSDVRLQENRVDILKKNLPKKKKKKTFQHNSSKIQSVLEHNSGDVPTKFWSD